MSEQSEALKNEILAEAKAAGSGVEHYEANHAVNGKFMELLTIDPAVGRDVIAELMKLRSEK